MTGDSIFDKSLKKSICGELPYFDFNNERNIAILKDGSLGVVYQVKPVEHEPMTENQHLELQRQLHSLLDLPENCVVQVNYTRRKPLVSDVVAAMTSSSLEGSNNVAKFLHEERKKYLLEKVASETDPILETNVLYSIRFFPPKVAPSRLKSLVHGDKEYFKSEMDSHLKHVIEFDDLLKRIEEVVPLEIKRLVLSELGEEVRRLVYSDYDSTNFSKIANGEALRDELLSTEFKEEDYSVVRSCGPKNKLYSKVITVKPKQSYPGMMSELLRLRFPFRVSQKVTFPKPAKVTWNLNLKEFVRRNNPSARSQDQLSKLREVQHQLSMGNRCVWWTMHIIVDGKSEEELSDRVNSVMSLLNSSFNTTGIIEESLGLSVFFNSLPLAYASDFELSNSRYMPLLQSDVIPLLGIHDSTSGLSEPMLTCTSREGNLLNFTVRDNIQLQHMATLGDSGSGKSRFIITLINCLNRIKVQPIIFVLEEKTSQYMNAKLNDGQLDKLQIGNGVSMSPFEGVYDESKFQFLSLWIELALNLTSKSFNLENEHRTAIGRALKEAYIKKSKRATLAYVDGNLVDAGSGAAVQVSMDDVMSELSKLPGIKEFEGLDNQIEELLNKLKPFYGDGVYADFFRPRKENLSFNKYFYVCDLEGVKDDPVLRDLSAVTLKERLRQIKIQPDNQDREVYMIIDEMASIDRGNPVMSKMLVDAGVKSRKEAVWVLGASNQPNNYFKLPACTALWEQSQTKVFLPMSAENVDKVAGHTDLLTEADKQIISSLEIRPGEFSEFYYITKSGKRGIGRLGQSAAESWFAPTNFKDGKAALDAVKKFAHSKWEALKYLVETYPQGTVVEA